MKQIKVLSERVDWIVAMDVESFRRRRNHANIGKHHRMERWFDPEFQEFVEKEVVPRRNTPP